MLRPLFPSFGAVFNFNSWNMLDFPALCQLQLSRVLAASSLPQTSTLTNPSSASSTASMTALLVPEPCGGDVCSTSNSCGPLPQPQTRVVRKRRRGEVANPANTLDGLVAQKTNGEPISSRFLCENDAIESPDDVIELKKMEKDPDVCTRTCSVCGYQGKWVSEMIRHKRVHTNDRPFKCKYCSRTSKWKADLIRHVASQLCLLWSTRLTVFRRLCSLTLTRLNNALEFLD